MTTLQYAKAILDTVTEMESHLSGPNGSMSARDLRRAELELQLASEALQDARQKLVRKAQNAAMGGQ